MNNSDLVSAWIIGPYLVLHTLFLTGLCLLVWLASDWSQFFELIRIHTLTQPIDPDKFGIFQRIVISACAAGLGGGVFMIREFYIKFSYGRDNQFLQRKEIPRYILLPFSSIILGPISLAFANAGAITFAGLSATDDIPTFTMIGLSFVLGFAYHDTLRGLAKLSENTFTSKKTDKTVS
jgi:hypothetical protein